MNTCVPPTGSSIRPTVVGDMLQRRGQHSAPVPPSTVRGVDRHTEQVPCTITGGQAQRCTPPYHYRGSDDLVHFTNGEVAVQAIAVR